MEATIYTTATCGYCKLAKDYLKNLGVSIIEKKVDQDPRLAEEMVRKTGQMGVPVITIKGTNIVGFDRNRIDNLLKN